MRAMETTAYAEKAWSGLSVVKWGLRSTAFKREIYSTTKLKINVNQYDPLVQHYGTITSVLDKMWIL